MCGRTGQFVKLLISQEVGLMADDKVPSHCFVPCGHMSSEKTVQFYAGIAIPFDSRGRRMYMPICPFCCGTLDNDKRYVKLLFQDRIDR